jgi:hypothetical protein
MPERKRSDRQPNGNERVSEIPNYRGRPLAGLPEIVNERREAPAPKLTRDGATLPSTPNHPRIRAALGASVEPVDADAIPPLSAKPTEIELVAWMREVAPKLDRRSHLSRILNKHLQQYEVRTRKGTNA